MIYLHNDTGIMLKVQDGQNADARFLFDLLIRELGVKKDDIRNVKEVFSLWLVSDLLGKSLASLLLNEFYGICLFRF